MASRTCKHGPASQKLKPGKCTAGHVDYAWPYAEGRNFLQQCTTGRAFLYSCGSTNFLRFYCFGGGFEDLMFFRGENFLVAILGFTFQVVRI